MIACFRPTGRSLERAPVSPTCWLLPARSVRCREREEAIAELDHVHSEERRARGGDSDPQRVQRDAAPSRSFIFHIPLLTCIPAQNHTDFTFCRRFSTGSASQSLDGSRWQNLSGDFSPTPLHHHQAAPRHAGCSCLRRRWQSQSDRSGRLCGLRGRRPDLGGAREQDLQHRRTVSKDRRSGE